MSQSSKQPLASIRSQKKPVSKTVLIAADSEPAERLKGLQEEIRRRRSSPLVRDGKASSAELSKLADMEEEAGALKEEVEGSALRFVFQSIGRRKYEALQAEYPPSEAQIKAAEAEGLQNLQFNPETFPFALIDAACVEPEHEEGELAEELDTDRWNNAEVQELFGAALSVHMTRSVVDLGKG